MGLKLFQMFGSSFIWIITINIMVNTDPIRCRKHKRGFLDEDPFEIEKGESLKKRLCQTIFCDENEECVLLPETYVAKCVCKDSCSKFRSTFDKVCTKDGQIFENLCALNLESCRKKQKFIPVDCGKLVPRQSLNTPLMVNMTSTLAPVIIEKSKRLTSDSEGILERLWKNHAIMAPNHITQNVKVHRIPLDVQYQILCDLPSPTWLRRLTPLDKILIFENTLKLSSDRNTLYLTPASSFHNGNFTCKSDDMQQIHVIKVESPEKLEVKPSFIMVTKNEPVTLTCSASNYEQGQSIVWFRNDQIFPEAINKSTLELNKTELKDTGSYRCEITSNDHKKVQSNVASVVVREKFDSAEKFYQSMKTFSQPQNTLVTFGQDGIEFYDQTNNCTLLKLLPAYLPISKFKSGFLCGQKKMCIWDQVVMIGNSKIFATLKNRKLLFRLDTKDLEIDAMSHLNFVPHKMIYNQKFDTLWIHGWDKGRGQLYFLKRVSTLRDTKFRPQISTNAKFNLSKIFIPSKENFSHGYLLEQSNPFQLTTIDLTNGQLMVNNHIDLKDYECVPDQVMFVEQKSMFIINCDEHRFSTNLFKTTRLMIDYLTHRVIDVNKMIRGKSKLTPDHRFLFTYDKSGEKMNVEQLQNNEDQPILINVFDLEISDDNWLIYQDTSNFGQWLLYALSSDGRYLLKFDFRIMKLDILKHYGKSKQYQNRVFQFNDIDSDLLLISSSDYPRVKITSIKNVDHSFCSLSRPVGVKFAFMF